MAFTKIVGAGIHTLSNIASHNIHSSGFITATKFVGQMENGSGISTFYDLKVTKNLTVEGTTTTLDTNLIGVDRVDIGANSNTDTAIVGIQSGTADIVNLFDGTTEVVTVVDGGSVGIGTTNPKTKLNVYTHPHTDTGGILVQNANYTSNLDKAYLIAGTQNWTGADTDWNSYGFQHKIKSDGDGNPRLTIDGSAGGSNIIEIITFMSSGEVGIGITNPGALLDIGGNTDGSIQAIMTRGADASFQLQFRNETSSNSPNSISGMFGLFRNDIDVVGMRLRRGTGLGPGSLTITTGGIEKLRVTSDGDVGIGTFNPTGTHALRNNTAKLAVGIITSKDVTINAGDYNGIAFPLKLKNDNNDNDFDMGTGIKLMGGSSTESYKWSGIVARGDSIGEGGYSNSQSLTFYTYNQSISNEGGTEKMRLSSKGELLVGITTVTDEATGNLIVDCGSSNIGGIQIHAGGGESASDLSGICFSHGNTGTAARPKAAIAFEKANTTHGRGDLCFYVDNNNNNNKVNITDEVMRVTRDSKVGIGTTVPDQTFHVHKGTAGADASSDGNAVITVENSDHSIIQMLSPTNKSNRIMFGDPDSANVGQISYDHNINHLSFKVDGSDRLTIHDTGEVSIESSGFLNIKTGAGGDYGVKEALRIDNQGGEADRALQFYEYHNNGGRWHSINMNLYVNSGASDYIYTQGNWGGSSMIKFVGGTIEFITDKQVSAGSTNNITPTQRLKITEAGFRQITGYQYGPYAFVNNTTKTTITVDDPGDNQFVTIKLILTLQDVAYRQGFWQGEYTIFASNATGGPGAVYYLKEHWQANGSTNWSGGTVTVAMSGAALQFTADNGHDDANGNAYVTILDVVTDKVNIGITA